MKFIFFLVLLMIFLPSNNSFASVEPILITKSPSMEQIIFDGKWTNPLEWKQSSHNMYSFDDGDVIIHLRTAHFENYIYVFIDPISDLTLDENLDNATICFDGKNNKTEAFDVNDFCFSTSLNNNQVNSFQGITDENSSMLKKIPNHENLIAISSISDENDRYSKMPHPGYEFKIPIDILERSDNYGFYFSVFDASSNQYYSWPENNTKKESDIIPYPSMWGDMISPDKSLPELHFPFLLFSIIIMTVILLQYCNKLKIFF